MCDLVRYVSAVRLDRAERFFFWESDGNAHDRVVLDDDGMIRAFLSERAARAAASAEGQALSPDEPFVYDLDAVDVWCRSSDDVHDCSELLIAWNLLGDLPRGELYAAVDERATPTYDKLFRGCNLPSMTPPGEHYVPHWSASETAALKHLLLLGLTELRARLR